MPVNQPKTPVNTYMFDGHMTYHHSGSAPVYAANSGVRGWADGKGAMADGWEADGEMVRSAYTLRPGDDDFTQPGILVRDVFTDDQRSKLVDQVAGSLLGGVREPVLSGAFGYWKKVDAEVGRRIEAKVRAGQCEQARRRHGRGLRRCANHARLSVSRVSLISQTKGITVHETRNVAVVVGSLRRDSINRKVANALAELAPASPKLHIVEIAHLPIYNQDGEENAPAAWTEFRDHIRAADAVLFVTPEHNRSVPAALKNALDVGSRPYGKSAWSGKPGAVVSASPGAIGGFAANHHLRQSLVFLDVPAMAQPEAYLGGADKLFDTNGKLVNDDTREFLRRFLQAYDAWIAANIHL